MLFEKIFYIKIELGSKMVNYCILLDMVEEEVILKVRNIR